MPAEKAISHLVRDYAALTKLYDAQPALTQHFLDQQAGAILSALEQEKHRFRYLLPDRIILEGGETLDLPSGVRTRTVGKSLRWNSRLERFEELVQHLEALEGGINPGLAVCGRLIRFALARRIVYHLLPDGRPVCYRSDLGDDIPSIPVDAVPPSALLASTDAVAEFDPSNPDQSIVQVPYVADARRFYLPQWVAFGEGDCLLVKSTAEAEACIASLEKTVHLLQDAVAILPCIVTDDTFQRKRVGLLGQLVNQGRALARFHTQQIIARIRHRAEAGTLNRGLSLDLPYFDDDTLALRFYPIEVIPSGRIMFIPALVALAMQRTEEMIHSDYQLSYSTRSHLLIQLRRIEDAFKKHPSTQEIG